MTERRWSVPFVEMLESLRMPAEFQAGRRYQRAGNVRSLRISSSLAAAVVHDDDGATYRTRVAVRTFSGADWRRIERALAEQAIYAARLLAGELPDDLDKVLGRLGLSLFPQDLPEVALDCSCTSRPVPCRHLTATWYALAESFDTDPFGILAWRGRGRDELLERLRALRTEARPAEPDPAALAPETPSFADAHSSRSPAGVFWTAGPRLPRPPGPDGGAAHRPDALLDQLEPLELTVGQYQVADLLRTAYRAMARRPPDP
jgi:uncharacterized Zn finger protein